ncbi:hypothetical protein OIV83_001364 [Microbotryomycetes sp. JL201]|nr:hypothetical protein OIV83_001364 [Microbotryomycetes sp. JL201]
MTHQPTPLLSAGMADALAARRSSAPHAELTVAGSLGSSSSATRHDTTLRSAAANPSRASLTLDRDGRPIRELDSVPVDLLQSLYLSPTATSNGIQTPPGSRPTTPSRPESVQPSPSQHLAIRSRTRSSDSNTSEVHSHHFPLYDWPKDRLMCMGHDVVVLDNFFSGSKLAISHWDVVEPFMVEVDQIYHLACPASPKAYQHNAVKTLKTNFMGTMNMLGLAKRVKARILLSSTSGAGASSAIPQGDSKRTPLFVTEIYGSPEQHPQSEEYWGNVNCVGPRACYDEGKRVAEALTYGYHRQDGVDVRVARIFNCYGPRMRQDDGRLVSNFIVAALRGEDLQVYGDGKATRSLMYVQDLVTGLIKLMTSSYTDPVNIGTEDEATVAEWARVIRDKVEEMRDKGEIPPSVGTASDEVDEQRESDVPELAEGGESAEVVRARMSANEPSTTQNRGRKSEIVFAPAVVDDPPRRRPDITRARTVLGWEPKYSLETGIAETIEYFAKLEAENEQ